jgi:hypothetical protein
VLLDHEGREQSRIPIANGDQPRAWPLDVDGDGNDELIAYTNEMVLAIEPTADSNTLWQRPVKRSFDDGIIQIIPATGDQPPLVVYKEGASICGLDASTGTVPWQCNGPRRFVLQEETEETVIPLVGSNKEEQSTLHGVVYTMGDVTICRRPVATVSSVVHPVAARLDGNLDDPRLLRDLPWMSEFVHQAEKPVQAIVTLVWYMALSTLLIVLPALYVRQLVRRRSWSLAMFLLLPVVAGIIMFSLTMPSPGYSQQLMPSSRFLMAMVMLPSVVLPLSCTLWAIRREWRRLLVWLAATVTLSFVFAGAILWIDSGQSGPAMGYSWKGWYTILVYGAYWIGWAMIVVGFRKWFFGIIKRWASRVGAENAETGGVSISQT